MTFSFAILVIVLFAWFLFRKSVSRITKVAPAITEIAIVNCYRAAVVADKHAATAAAASALEAVDECSELADSRGIAFNGDPIDFCDSVLRPHDYSRVFKAQKNQPQP